MNEMTINTLVCCTGIADMSCCENVFIDIRVKIDKDWFSPIIFCSFNWSGVDLVIFLQVKSGRGWNGYLLHNICFFSFVYLAFLSHFSHSHAYNVNTLSWCTLPQKWFTAFSLDVSLYPSWYNTALIYWHCPDIRGLIIRKKKLNRKLRRPLAVIFTAYYRQWKNHQHPNRLTPIFMLRLNHVCLFLYWK